MSYCRQPFYIWSDCRQMHFMGTAVDEEEINVLLYKILLTCCRDDLAERIQEGKKMIADHHGRRSDYMKWAEGKEDEFVKELLQRKIENCRVCDPCGRGRGKQ